MHHMQGYLKPINFGLKKKKKKSTENVREMRSDLENKRLLQIYGKRFVDHLGNFYVTGGISILTKEIK